MSSINSSFASVRRLAQSVSTFGLINLRFTAPTIVLRLGVVGFGSAAPAVGIAESPRRK